MNIADKSSYSGGVLNCICEGACYAFIGGGGGKNTPIGQGNTVSGNYSSVVGGGGCTAAGTAGGNCVTGNFSAVLGGQSNLVTHNFASASGYNVVSVSDCAFHANNFVGQNMPTSSGGASGSFYTCAALGGLVVMVNP
jgi:hypothetical protein